MSASPILRRFSPCWRGYNGCTNKQETVILSAQPHAHVALVQERLRAWFTVNHRVLPWRTDPTPYHVLLSELMLQQTRVETAIPYFHRFAARWPTLRALGEATESEVLSEWAGLGYYSRARNLHRTAQLTADLGLPKTAKELVKLPGIGPYTAGAIASIAFAQRSPVVDGNVERVLCRLDGRDANPRAASGKKALWARAEELVPHEDPGDHNQALMELGATVCSPKKPKCGQCPLAVCCIAHAIGDPESLPKLPKRTPPKPVFATAGMLVEHGKIALGQRPSKGLLPNLWEPISTPFLSAHEDRDLPVSFVERTGVHVVCSAHLGTVVHVFTHRKLTLDVYAVQRVRDGRELNGAVGYYSDVRWVDLLSPDVPLSTLARKTLATHPGA